MIEMGVVLHKRGRGSVYIFNSNQEIRGSVGPVKQQYKLKWPKVRWGYSDSGVIVTNCTLGAYFANTKGGSRTFVIA
jgi:hypothetical protein